MHNPAEDNKIDGSNKTDDDNEYAADTDFLAADSDNAAGQIWNQITDAMWTDYQQLLQERNIGNQGSDLSDDEDAWINEDT